MTTKPLAAAEIPIPDLLAEGTAPRIDVAEARQMLVFAFAMGGSVESFEQMLASAALPASAWDRAHFGRDLFLDELVERCLSLRIGGRVHEPCTAYLLRAISAPPRSREVVAFRRAILAELAEKETLRRDLERSYAALAKLRTLFCAGRYEVRWLRRLDILRAAHEAFAVLAASFADAESGLSRVRAFGEAVRGSQAYERLSALLDHEEHLGTVDLRVRVGSDGELRTFQIVAVRENSDNPFHSSPLGRWIARFKLFLRGFRMNGGEVIERLFDDVFAGIEEPLALAFQLFGDMEFYLAGLGCKALAEERGLSVCLPDLTDPGGDEDTTGWDARGLFNPLLLGEKKTPIACDLRTKHHGSVVVVTGPNSGGKTRLLQAIAITQMLGETGLFVPAASARMPRASGLFVSLVEEARADQPEGQLGMELMRIRRMFEQLDVGSLVLLDELCSGTNPSEGEEIARLVISLLPELDAQVFVTTHLLSFAQHLDEDRPIARLEFLQVELDAHERPTYGFVPGVARTSLAHKTAARLGVTRDELALLIAEKKRGRGESTPVTMGPQAAPNPAPPVAAPRSSKRASAKKVAAAK